MNRIKEHLDRQNKTPYWLAAQSGISRTSIYHMVSGDGVDIDDLKYKTVRLIAATLKVEIEDLRAV